MGSACPSAFHDALKRNPVAWAKLRYVGIQHFGPGITPLELRNCTCGDTLSVEAPAATRGAA